MVLAKRRTTYQSKNYRFPAPSLGELLAKRSGTDQNRHSINLCRPGVKYFRRVVQALAGSADPADIAAAAIKLVLTGSAWWRAGGKETPRWIVQGAGARSGFASFLRIDWPARGSCACAPGRRQSSRGLGGRNRAGLRRGRAGGGIRPGDLVGAIANEAGVPSRMIGAIEVEERFSLSMCRRGGPADIEARHSGRASRDKRSR